VNFFLVFCKTRKKLDKYFKVNKIRNKYVIDIKKILEEEKINIDDSDAIAFFKVLIWKKIQLAKEKKKDVYYIPNFYNPQIDVSKLLELKNVLSDDQNFNLLLFFQEFVGTNWLNIVLEEIDNFNHSQIIKDY
jgi:hypothetical protein